MCRLSNLAFPLEKNLSLPPLPKGAIKCTPCKSDECIKFLPRKLPFENGPVIEVSIASATVLTDGDDVKTAVEIILDVSEHEFAFLPGDSIGVLPENPDDEVNALLKRLNIENTCFKIDIDPESPKKKTGLPPHIPPAATSEFLLRRCLDIRAVVKKGFLRSLIDFTSDNSEIRRLEELCSKEGSSEYNSQVLGTKCSISEILEAFPSCRPPISLLIEHLPRLQVCHGHFCMGERLAQHLCHRPLNRYSGGERGDRFSRFSAMSTRTQLRLSYLGVYIVRAKPFSEQLKNCYNFKDFCNHPPNILEFSSLLTPSEIFTKNHIPRPYSVASSPLESSNKVRIIFNLVYDGKRRGLCSGWLYDVSKSFFDVSSKMNSLSLNDGSPTPVARIPIYLRKPTVFRIPENPSVPLIMVGTGTGVAPFLGFLEHRRKQLKDYETEPKNRNWLIFGCRYPGRDEIFREVFRKYETENICQYFVSYSRGGKEGHKKYVQDILMENEFEIVSEILSSKACFCICGNGLTMGKQIIQTLTECIQRVQGSTEEEAKETIANLERDGKILKDLWI